MSVAETMVADFNKGTEYYLDGKHIVEMLVYEQVPARIDGKDDEEMIAVRVDGELESAGLEPVDVNSDRLRYAFYG